MSEDSEHLRIIHRLLLDAHHPSLTTLEKLNARVQKLNSKTMIVQVEESDPAWVVAARLVTEGVTESPPETIFTKTELKQSRWLRLNATWHEGFPQPEEDYQRQTYDLSDFCAVCGTGYEQRAPFQFASEPNWGRRHILQFNWVFDEFFVPPETFRGVFQPLGIESRPVVHHKTGHELKSVVQLRVKNWTAHDIDQSRWEWEKCARCGRKKLTGFMAGRFPHVELPRDTHLGWTREYSGSGAPQHGMR